MVAAVPARAMSARDFGRDRYPFLSMRIRRRRHELGLRQLDLSDRLADMGLVLTHGAMSHIENGQGLDISKLPEMAVALECTLTYLLGWTDDPAKWEPDRPLAETLEDEATRVYLDGQTALSVHEGGRDP